MIDINKYSKRFSMMFHSNQNGAVLIWCILIMVVVSIFGSSMIYLNVSSTYGKFFANSSMRAYYVAEAGGRYAIPKVAQNPVAAEANLSGQTFTLSSGEQFVLAVDNNTLTQFILLQSTSTINKNAWLEAKRTISYLVKQLFSDNFSDPLFLDANWTKNSHSAYINSTDRSGNLPALNIRGQEVYVNLNWDGNTNISDLAEWRIGNNDLLNYELQVKLKEDTQGSLGEHYMWGLSFRLNTDPAIDSTYGISFFRSIGRGDNQRPGWIDTLPSTFDVLMTGTSSGKRHIILWKKESGVYSLLDYKLLLYPQDGVLLADGTLKPWSTLMVQIFESFKSDGITRQNSISAFIRDTDTYPRNTIDWDFNSSMALQWDTNIQPIIDGSLTTENFDAQRPVEIGLHAFYDSPAANDQFFQDFAMNLLSNSGGVFIETIQY